MPRRPLSDEDLVAKFASCVGQDRFSVPELRDSDLISMAHELLGKTNSHI
jgi:hypothetical protein